MKDKLFMGLNFSDESILSFSEKMMGRRRFLWFTRINAISFGCLAESILILYAIKNGAEDWLIGVIASFFQLTMPLMFIGKGLIGKFGASRTFALSWIFRNLSGAMLILVPFFSRSIHPTVGLFVLALSAFGFFGFRSIGFTANTPLIAEVTDKNNRGKFISQIWLHFNLFYLFTMLALIGALKLSNQMLTYQIIIIFGSLAGLVAAFFILRVPETIHPRNSGQLPIRHSFYYLLKTPRPRKLLFAWSAASAGMVLINSFSMVSLKNGYLISDNSALAFSMIQIGGGIVAAFVNSIFLDRVGPRPMLILYSCGLIVISLLWIASPGQFVNYYFIPIFLLIGLNVAGTSTALSHYFLSIVPDQERVSASILVYVISGIVAGLTGAFVGGGLLRLLRILNFSGLVAYRIYFIVIALILIPLVLIIRRIERLDDWRIKDVLGIFFSFRDIRSLYTLHRLQHESNNDTMKG
ncbi:MAG: MFS transporter [bacterium]|nr:MFS transporter [bacterium]